MTNHQSDSANKDYLRDCEIACKCADAMGWTVEEYSRGWRVRDQNCDNDIIYFIYKFGLQGGRGRTYDPLNNDEHSFALVKKLGLEIVPPQCRANHDWRVTFYSNDPASAPILSRNANLNRAISECAAKMQAPK